MQDVLSWLIEDYSDASKGIGVIKLGDGYIMAIKQAYLPYVEKLYRPQMNNLSMAALETLAIVAYKQPVTRGEIELIRGVKADKIIQNLIGKELIEEQGRKDAPGRPILYGTTRRFLQYFNIESLAELPTIALLNLNPDEAESLVAEELELLELSRTDGSKTIIFVLYFFAVASIIEWHNLHIMNSRTYRDILL